MDCHVIRVAPTNRLIQIKSTEEEFIIVRSLDAIIGSDRDISGPGWNSRRILLAVDGMGYSLHDTIIEKGAELTLE
jgi:L-ectoine synthase